MEGSDKSDLEFGYDASGNRAYKKEIPTAGTSDFTTWYVHDAQGNILATYKTETLKSTGEVITTTLNEQAIYGSSRLGLKERNLDVTSLGATPEMQRSIGKKRYELTDHLGNVLSVLGDAKIPVDEGLNGTIDYYRPSLHSTAAYYPGGSLMPGRNYNANSYRYGQGGQEKTDEISGTGNHYTALYWEYDPRLIRRWNLDSKPNPSVSFYATFANNPIWVTDLLGDTAVVKWKSGGLFGMKNQHEARYVNDTWIDANTRQAIDVNSVARKSAKNKMNDYNTLNQLSPFDPVTDEINNGKNNVNLFSSNGPNQVGPEIDNKKYFTELYGGNANPDINVYLPNVSGIKSDLVMIHELGHTWDLLRSGRSIANFKSNGSGASYSEINAMYWENILRSLHKMPLRIEYNPGVSGTPRANVKYKALPPYTLMFGKMLYLKTTLKNLDGTQTYDFYK